MSTWDIDMNGQTSDGTGSGICCHPSIQRKGNRDARQNMITADHKWDTVDCGEWGSMAGTSGAVWEMAGSVCRVSSVDTAWDV